MTNVLWSWHMVKQSHYKTPGRLPFKRFQGNPVGDDLPRDRRCLFRFVEAAGCGGGRFIRLVRLGRGSGAEMKDSVTDLREATNGGSWSHWLMRSLTISWRSWMTTFPMKSLRPPMTLPQSVAICGYGSKKLKILSLTILRGGSKKLSFKVRRNG